MKSKILVALAGSFLFFLVSVSCTSEIKTVKEKNAFPITNPLVVDTVFVNEYIADIQSIQNVGLRTQVKGYLESINVDEGEYVKSGQVLSTIGNKFYKQDLLKAQANLKSALAAERTEELNLKNVQLLVKQNVVSLTELELSQAKLEAAKALVEEAKSNESLAYLNLSLTEIRAPFDGIINRIPNKQGSFVEEGTLLTSISNNKEVYAYFHISEREYLEFLNERQSAQKTTVDLVLTNNSVFPLKGKIETIAGEINKNTGNIAVRAKFPNPNKVLLHGSSGKILYKTELKQAMVIPQKSTFEIQEHTYVYVVDEENKVKLQKVFPRLRIKNIFVIEPNLSKTDKILFEGIQLVNEGDLISPETISSKLAYSPINE